MSTINVDTVLPQSGNTVNVNGIELRSLAGGPGTVNKYIGTTAPTSLTANANLMVGSGGSGITTGNRNTVLGLFSGGALTVGDDNVAVGTGALTTTQFGSDNIAIGRNSLGQVINPFGEVAIGHLANQFFTTATVGPNTAVGFRALWQNLTGGQNTALGAEAGSYITTGSDNTYLGTYSGVSATTGSNNTCIGYNSTTATATTSNSITLGNSSNNVLRCAVTSITSLSDARDKKEITELSAGLDFVNTLKPVEFVWDDRNEEGKHDVKDFGFIAQDLKQSQEDIELADTLKLVYEENPEKLEASYGKLIPILVKAIQELSEEVKQLKTK
jgi:hypothetical protein